MSTHSIHPISDADPLEDARILPPGKVPGDLLTRLIRRLPTHHPQLLLGPGLGEDAAVIDFAPISPTSPGGDRLLVAKSDPITFATEEIGYYAVNVCANDLAVTGATPQFYLPTLLLPAHVTTPENIRAVFDQIGAACADLGIAVAGGHTEITGAVNQPVVAGTMLGQVERGRFVPTGGCRPGDLVLLAGAAPVEGASLIAREKRGDLLAAGWAADDLDRAADLLFDPGISVLIPALAAARSGLVTAMHDPTEGGVATGLLELALAAQAGLSVDLDAIPVLPLAAALCAAFGLDPLGTIASGSLLATCAPENVDELLAVWASVGWDGAVIGRILAAGEGIRAQRGRRRVDFPRFQVDEITKLWATL